MVKDLKTKKKMLNIDGHKIEDKFDGLTDQLKIEMLKKMYRIRHFENEVEQFLIRGMIHGTCHLVKEQDSLRL